MSWEAGSTIFGIGLALFSLVAPMIGLTLPRPLLSILLGLSVLLIFMWPVSIGMAWLQERLKIDRATGFLPFIVVGAILGGIAFGIIWYNIPPTQNSSARDIPSAQEIAKELSGGNNFCYFQLYDTKPQSLKGPFQLAMIGNGIVKMMNFWIAPASSKDPKSPGGINASYWSLDHRKPVVQIVHSGGRAWDVALPVGEYWIDFAAENGNWTEILKIYISNGELKQSIKVTREGKVIYDLESPKKQ